MFIKCGTKFSFVCKNTSNVDFLLVNFELGGKNFSCVCAYRLHYDAYSEFQLGMKTFF